jgi:predicted Fe-S protein YdhL (DUF1289 family)
MNSIAESPCPVWSEGQKSLESVPSPCVRVCRIDAASGWCAGCWRTLDEIAQWRAMSDAQRLDVWARIGQRNPHFQPAQHAS